MSWIPIPLESISDVGYLLPSALVITDHLALLARHFMVPDFTRGWWCDACEVWALCHLSHYHSLLFSVVTCILFIADKGPRTETSKYL